MIKAFTLAFVALFYIFYYTECNILDEESDSYGERSEVDGGGVFQDFHW